MTLRILIATLLAVATCTFGVARAEDAGPTTVLFLTLPTADLTVSARENTVATELALALLDLTVQRRGAATDLAALPAADQVEALRPLFAEGGVLAAVWLDPGPDPLRLNIGFAGPGRSVVRVVEERAAEGAEAAMAVAAREILAAARRPEPTSPAEPTEQTPTPALDLRLVGGAAVSFDGELGAIPRGVVVIELESRLVGRLRTGFGLAVRVGGVSAVESLVTEIGGRGRLAFLPGNDLVGGGPVIGAEIAWLRVAAPRVDGERGAVSLPMIRFSPGVELRVASREGPGLCLTATVDLLPLRGQARRRSDEALLHDTGTVGLSIHAGVRIPL